MTTKQSKAPKPYIIRRTNGGIEISARDNHDLVASYALTPGREDAQIRAWRREIDAHLAAPGGTLGNYQW